LIVQLGIGVLSLNVLVLAVNFIFQYHKMEKILLDNYSRNSTEWFEQLECSINKYVEQADTMLLEFIVDNDVNQLEQVKGLLPGKEVQHINRVINSFQAMLTKDKSIRAIGYYGRNDMEVVYYEGKVAYRIYKENQREGYSYNDVFQDLSTNRQKRKWLGGYSEENFGFPYKNEQPEYLISVYRKIENGSGVIVLHYDMETFLDQFYVGKDSTKESVYLLDETNRIVASRDISRVGEEKLFENGEQTKEGVFQYVIDGEEGEIQAVVYDLPSMGWRVVSEKTVKDVTRDSVHMRNVMLLTSSVSTVLLLGMLIYFLRVFLNPISGLAAKMQEVARGELGGTIERIPENEIGVLTTQFNEMSLNLEKLFDQNQQNEAEKRRLEMQVLRAQINPHFIYNTLNTIKWMAVIREERGIAESISLLADFLKPVFRNQSALCTIAEELDYVEKYIAIMNLRDGNKYLLDIAVTEEYYRHRILRFLLQPIVENAILHGFAKTDTGLIRIRMWQEEGIGILRIEDDGEGIDPHRLRTLQQKLLGEEEPETGLEKHIGLANVNRRIRLQFGQAYGLTVDNRESRGFMVTLRIPLEED